MHSAREPLPFWQQTGALVLLLAAGGGLLLSGCGSAPFLAYDDTKHIADALACKTWGQLLAPSEGTWFPLTLLSYQIDHAVFAGWLGMENWAVGVRAMNCVYHVLAAVVLWRVMLRLGLERTGGALFVALAFVVHPLACETVCWASERKNTLAALLGFLSLLVWLRAEGRWWRALSVAPLYFLACLGKPSALGLIPVFCALELLRVHAPRLADRDGLPVAVPQASSLLFRIAELALLCAIAGVVVWVNTRTHSDELKSPPGGSIYTALLTDLEILSRYLFSLVFPVRLSAVYFVEPILSLTDVRAMLYGGLLAGVVASTLFLARNRRMALFAWLWFLGALGPNLNLIALAHIMQDRYLYLSTPAFFMLLVEVSAGLCQRLPFVSKDASRFAAVAFLLALAFVACARSPVFRDMHALFVDAVSKQPQSAYARFGLGSAYAEKAYALRVQGKHGAGQALWKGAIDEWRYAVDRSSDALRFADYSFMAMQVADACKSNGDAVGYEHYLTLAAFPPGNACVRAAPRATALGLLSALHLSRNDAEGAYQLAQSALELDRRYDWLLARARAGLALAAAKRQAGDVTRADVLLAEARDDLRILKSAAVFTDEVEKLLADPRF